MAAVGVRRDKAALFQWVQAPVVRKYSIRQGRVGGELSCRLWHDGHMVALLKIAVHLLADVLRLVILLFRTIQSIQTENLFLRRQLALFMEHGVRPRRVDAATRVRLALLARMFDWRNALVVVQPATMIRWHRAGWRLFWRFKSRSGRPRIPTELRALIRRMAIENRSWGEERIANELVVKLGIRVSPRTVSKYMPKRPPGQPRGDQRSATFLKNHAKAIQVPKVRDFIRNAGYEPDGIGPVEFRKMIESDFKRYAEVVRAANIKAE